MLEAPALPVEGPSRGGLPNAGAQIRTRLPSLAAAEQRVARFLVEEPAEGVRLPVKQLASRIGVSDATVVRTAQALGFAGLRELKLALAAELATPLAAVHESIGPGDDNRAILRKVLASDSQAVLDAADTVNPTAFDHAVTALAAAPRIDCLGVGSSLPICLDAAYRFVRIGLPAFCFPDPHMQAVAAGRLPALSVGLVISHTGRTTETLAAARAAKGASAFIVLLTSHGGTPLEALADIALVCSARETIYRTEAMASRIAHLAVIDALTVALATRRLGESVAAMEQADAAIAAHRLP